MPRFSDSLERLANRHQIVLIGVGIAVALALLVVLATSGGSQDDRTTTSASVPLPSSAPAPAATAQANPSETKNGVRGAKGVSGGKGKGKAAQPTTSQGNQARGNQARGNQTAPSSRPARNRLPSSATAPAQVASSEIRPQPTRCLGEAPSDGGWSLQAILEREMGERVRVLVNCAYGEGAERLRNRSVVVDLSNATGMNGRRGDVEVPEPGMPVNVITSPGSGVLTARAFVIIGTPQSPPPPVAPQRLPPSA